MFVSLSRIDARPVQIDPGKCACSDRCYASGTIAFLVAPAMFAAQLRAQMPGGEIDKAMEFGRAGSAERPSKIVS